MTQTNKQARERARTTREKVAAQRAVQQRAERRRRTMLIGGSVVAVLAVIGALVAVGLTTGGSKGSTNAAYETRPAAASVTSKVTSVPPDVFAAVGKGSVLAVPQRITGDPLTVNGKPEMLYIGAEFCPYCAGERWALAAALSRFGTFDKLDQTKSAPTDNPADLSTLSFRGAKYTSDYLAFTPVEAQTNKLNAAGTSYTALDAPTKAQDALWTKYGTDSSSGSRGYPFVDLANKWHWGVSYDVTVLAGKTWQQIADAMHDPTSNIAKAIDGSANVITATICDVTGGQPATVCTAAGVKAAAAALPK